jgi:hypothetical protein
MKPLELGAVFERQGFKEKKRYLEQYWVLYNMQYFL